MPSPRLPIADHRANFRAVSDAPGVSHARSAYAPYASTPIGSVIDVLSFTASQMPGSGWMTPKPHSVPRPTHPLQTATAAGAAMTNSGHRGTGRLTGHHQGAR